MDGGGVKGEGDGGYFSYEGGDEHSLGGGGCVGVCGWVGLCT